MDFEIRITSLGYFEEILYYSWTNFPGTSERFANGVLNHLDHCGDSPGWAAPGHDARPYE